MAHWLKIYDHSKREAQNHSRTFMAHWWTFMTKEKVIHDKKNLWPFQARSAKPFMNIYGSLMLIYDPKKKVIHAKKNLCLIYVSLVENLWPFQARSAKPFMNIYDSLMLIYDPKKKSFMLRKIFDSFMIIFDQRKKPFMTRKIYDHFWLKEP
mgnify:CR=1 FL=1